MLFVPFDMVVERKNREEATARGSQFRLVAIGFALVALCGILLEASFAIVWLVRLLGS